MQICLLSLINELFKTEKPKTINMSKQEIDDLRINKCIECGIDMGECNPRQYCGKTYCFNQ